MTTGEALRLLRDSRDGLRIFAPGEVEQLAALAGVGVTVVRVDLTTLAAERVEIAPPPGVTPWQRRKNQFSTEKGV